MSQHQGMIYMEKSMWIGLVHDPEHSLYEMARSNPEAFVNHFFIWACLDKPGWIMCFAQAQSYKLSVIIATLEMQSRTVKQR